MAASIAGAFRRARISSTWIPRQIRNIIVCSQTLYFLFKGFIDRQRKEVVAGEEKSRRSIFFFLALRAPRSRARELADVFENNEKKNKTTSVYRLGI